MSDRAAQQLPQSTETATLVELEREQGRDHDPPSQLAPCEDGDGDGKGADLRRALERAIERQVRASSPRVLMWLASRAKTATPPSPSTPDHELRAILSALTTEELDEFVALRDEA